MLESLEEFGHKLKVFRLHTIDVVNPHVWCKSPGPFDNKLIDRALKESPDNGAYLDSRAWALYKQGKIKLDELISRYRPLGEINTTFDDMNRGRVARTVLMFA